MTYKVKISDLSLDQLSATCLTKISQFAVALEQLDGRILKLNSDTLMLDIVDIGRSTDDVILKTMYRSIKAEIKAHINSPRFAKHNQQASNNDIH